MDGVRHSKSMNFWYSIEDPKDRYYDYVRRIPEYYTDDDIDDVINSMMRKHGVDELWYAIEKKGKYISSGITTICRPN